MQTVEQVKEALEKREPVTSLASLVRVAIEDGREMLKRKRVRPSYSTWCTTRESYKPPHPDATNEEIALAQDDDQQFECFVCLGGAVLIGAVGFDPFVNGLYQAKEPHHFPLATSDAMRALDQVRQGSVTNGLLHPRLGCRSTCWHMKSSFARIGRTGTCISSNTSSSSAATSSGSIWTRSTGWRTGWRRSRRSTSPRTRPSRTTRDGCRIPSRVLPSPFGGLALSAWRETHD